MRVGGLIVIDNVLWHGKVADPLVNSIIRIYLQFHLNAPDFLCSTMQVNDNKTVSIRNFNQQLLEDKRVSISMVSLQIFLITNGIP